jgi:phospholipase C
MSPPIKNIFVLMLENRSFDHMLGFSGLSGTDAATGEQTNINGPHGQFNTYAGVNYPVDATATDPMPVDPAHEFVDVVTQLCGADATYPLGGPYPNIDNSGFVAAYAYSPSPEEGDAPGDYGRIMSCQAQERLPVLTALASAFGVCDSWHSSLPGPTVPNRLFALAASSAGLDHSPSSAELITWETFDGLEFPNGTLFDQLTEADDWRIYSDGPTALSAALKGIHPFDIRQFSNFAADINQPNYSPRFTWIEPDYGDMILGTYKGGTSQHPLDGVTGGETLIKQTYEALRASPIWLDSLLIVTWDEHGGFYDHVAPPPASPPGDTVPGSKYNQYHFSFDRYGVRVPAVVVSPYIAAGSIDHRLYDHSSIPKTVAATFGLSALTARDEAANSPLSLLSLPEPRNNTPLTLPAPAQLPVAPAVPATAARPADAPLSGNAASFLHVAMRQDLAVSPPAQKHAILARVQAIRTRGEAAQYVSEVNTRVVAHRNSGGFNP